MEELHSLLIVDDERVIRDGLSTMVDWASLGFHVAGVFADGRDARAFISDHAVDVVLTDIRMTFVSGIDLARELRGLAPDTRVVLLSGHREFELAQQAVSVGVYDYLLKPVDFAQLRRVFATLAEEIRSRKRELAAKASEESTRAREHLLLIAQFYQRVLSEPGLTQDAVLSLWHQVGKSGTLERRPVGLISCRSEPGARGTNVEPQQAAVLLDNSRSEISYVALARHGSVDGAAGMIVAHALQHTALDEFLTAVESDIGVVRDGLRTTFGAAVSLEIVERHADLPTAAGCLRATGAVSALPDRPRGGTHESGEHGPARVTHPHVERAMQFLSDHYTESIGLAETATALALSPAYLSRVFSEHARMTLIEYLTRLRVERACSLLIGTDLPIEEVAGLVGYVSSSHFSRVFKREMGVSAGKYRAVNWRNSTSG